MHDEFVSVNGLRLHTIFWGADSAPPILLLHGNTGQARDWQPVADLLSADYRLIAPDRRGYGDSDWSPTESYGQMDNVADVVALCEALNLANIIFVGHSFSARTAWVCAAQHPALITSVVLVDSGPEADPKGMRRTQTFLAKMPEYFSDLEEAVSYFQGHYPYFDEPTLRSRLEYYLKSTGSGWAPKFDKALRDRLRKPPKASNGPDLWETLRRVKCPGLLVRAERSPTLTEAIAQRMLAENHNLQYCLIPDCGHNIPGEKPHELAQAIRKFVAVHVTS